MKKSLITLLILLLCGASAARAAVEEPVWVEAVGESVGSEYDPPKEVMERARNDAKRRAIEEAVGSFVRSHTLVSNAQVAEDLTFARARGRIEKVETISEERDRKTDVYRVRLRALVRPVYPQEGDGIHLKLSLTKSNLKEGDEVKVYYEPNADCYVYIFSIGSDNSVTLLFPNSQYRDNFVKANSGQVFPPESCPIHLRAMCLPDFKAKLAEEKVKVIATRNREILLTSFQEGMFKVYDAKSTGLVGDLARKLNQLDPADWGEAVVTYSIEK